MNIENLEWVKESSTAMKLRWRTGIPNPYRHNVFAAVTMRDGAPTWIARKPGQFLTGTIPCESMEDGMKQAETYAALTNYDTYLEGTT